MANLWSFLYQTISVSLTAVILLVLKRCFQDKLSPRWQYAAWGILALRVLIPANTKRSFLIPLALLVEMAKTAVEGLLSSAYSAPQLPVRVSAPLPVVTGLPHSVTDVLFLVYVGGVLVVLARYLAAYIGLRRFLRTGTPVSGEEKEKIREVALRYGLKDCPAIRIPQIRSAFICGVLRPVLVLPEESSQENTEEKILLHEFLHLRYGDTLQNLFWCILRALHWCNPFLQYVFDQVGNDMETLCDQRVLERLSGEDCREYGRILLKMANDQYARFPGTTSISNGGPMIAKRIEAIVRFRKYPKGIALASVCILFLTGAFCLSGSRTTYADELYHPDRFSSLGRLAAESVTRINRCSTPAAALDTYAKGLFFENDTYLAMASPVGQGGMKERPAYLRETLTMNNAASYTEQTEMKILSAFWEGPDRMKAWLSFQMAYSYGYVQEEIAAAIASGELPLYCTVLVPVEVVRDSDGWSVIEITAQEMGEEPGSTQKAEAEGRLIVFSTANERLEAPKEVWQQTLMADTGYGTVEAWIRSELAVSQPEGWSQNGAAEYLFGSAISETVRIPDRVDPDASFSTGIVTVRLKYDALGGTHEAGEVSGDYVEVQGTVLALSEDHGESWEETSKSYGAGDKSYSSNDGLFGLVRATRDEDNWDGTMVLLGTFYTDAEEAFEAAEGPIGVRIFQNGKEKAAVRMGGVDHE